MEIACLFRDGNRPTSLSVEPIKRLRALDALERLGMGRARARNKNAIFTINFIKHLRFYKNFCLYNYYFQIALLR